MLNTIAAPITAAVLILRCYSKLYIYKGGNKNKNKKKKRTTLTFFTTPRLYLRSHIESYILHTPCAYIHILLNFFFASDWPFCFSGQSPRNGGVCCHTSVPKTAVRLAIKTAVRVLPCCHTSVPRTAVRLAIKTAVRLEFHHMVKFYVLDSVIIPHCMITI